jgi:alpha-mannosidase/mannosylglycerate hydrolase
MPRKAHYVLSTHWDREWYQPFQDFRYRLVQLIDRVLDGWQREELCGPFQTDGQAIVLEDYLEVRPERAEQIRQLVREGRFVVGPWYVLPDEFLVSGEALVRNLLMGRQVARRFGGQPSNAGFMCDMFGHNSQMPQIFSGFGIGAAFLWRGINLVEEHLFRWQGADGTQLPTYRFGKIGYCSFAAQVRVASPLEPRPTPAEIGSRLEAFLEEENEKTKTGPLLLFDGGDHMEWDEKTYSVLSPRLGKPDDKYDLVHSSLDAYMAELLPHAAEIGPLVAGELREPGIYSGEIDQQWLIPGVASSRFGIKQANAACQNLLCQWAEPVSAFAHALIDLSYPRGYLDVAWRWLLMNHPHDSICGCSIDAVHRDMVYRFHQSEGIAARLTIEAARRLAASVQVNEAHSTKDEVRLVVFNPLSHPLDGVVDLDLEVPTHWPTFGEMMGSFEPIPAFRVYDTQGNEIPYQRNGLVPNRIRTRIFDATFPQEYRVHVVQASLPLQIPAGGYTTLLLRPTGAGQAARLSPAEKGEGASHAVGQRAMENQYLFVSFEPDGGLNVLDKRTGQAYHHLLTFEDCADIGDGWNFGPVTNDMLAYSTAGRSSLALVSSGPYRTTFRLRTVMELPVEFDFGRMVRSANLCELVIDSLVSLRTGADYIEIETTVHNNVKDHRLRVLFPSDAAAETCLMDTPFDVVERPVRLRADNDRIREMEVETRPQQSFTAVFDPQRGLAVVSTGLMEAAVQDTEERPVALTLYRSTRRTVGTNGEPDGQLTGDLTFRCWIVPLQGEPDRAHLLHLGQALGGGVKAVHLLREDVERYRQPRALPVSASFLRVDGPVVLTSLRRTDAGLEARLFNPNTFAAEAVLDLSGWPEGTQLPGKAVPVDFESNPVGEPAPILGGKVTVSFGPKQIRTLLFQ